MLGFIRFLLAIAAIYWGITFGVAVGRTDPAWGVILGFFAVIVLLLVAGAISRGLNYCQVRYRAWQHEREYGH